MDLRGGRKNEKLFCISQKWYITERSWRLREKGGRKRGGNKEVRDIFVEQPVFFQDDTEKYRLEI